MELLLLSTCTAICIALFAVFRIPLNRFTVPSTAIAGLFVVFGLIQVLNYYHPYSAMSHQQVMNAPIAADIYDEITDDPAVNDGYDLVAWFPHNRLLRLHDGDAAEVTFDSIPGKVFLGEVQLVLPAPGEDRAWARDYGIDPIDASGQPRIPVVISISDPRYDEYVERIPGGSRAKTAVYGDDLQQLAVLRKTLLRMSAWMNYLSPLPLAG